MNAIIATDYLERTDVSSVYVINRIHTARNVALGQGKLNQWPDRLRD
ncbi:MAG: hypothetical protein M0Z81_08450 [Deltaproteobacteria bacterium]|nr:hypothetical protein [Deltaproteobacteria bacterium]